MISMTSMSLAVAFVGAFAASELGAQVAMSCAGIPISVPRAIYVSPSGADSASCGSSPSAPCLTIQQGINNCSGFGCGVLIRHGLYQAPATITLANGVNLYGGCNFDNPSLPYRTTVTGPSPVISVNQQVRSPTTIHGMVVVANDAPNAGQASIALVVTGNSLLSLSQNVLASGKGAVGTPGNTTSGGPGGGGNYPNGNSGGGGGQSCVNNPSGSDGDGGQGADFQQVYSSGCFVYCNCSNNNYPNSLGRTGHSSGSVQGGGGGQRGGPGCGCGKYGNAGDGPPGNPGNPGPCSTQAGMRSTNVIGSFNGTAWAPAQAGSGGGGAVGSGGGGGGSGGFTSVPGYPDTQGTAGGGGGGGGCGGPGGGGGGQGGASIPLVVAGTIVQWVSSNTLIPGPGGNGGSGATGGTGGPGGPGEVGVSGHYVNVDITWGCSGTAPGDGGTGGVGGQGGAGSGGAGGNGGPSFGIALVHGGLLGGPAVILPAKPGAFGSGGAGGQNNSSQCQGAKGQDGLAGFSDDSNSVVTYQ